MDSPNGKTRLPGHLSKLSRQWARRILSGWALEPPGVELLIMACETKDRIAQARERVKRDGAFGKDRWGVPKAHPGLREERDGRIVLARLLRELSLGPEPEDSRPPALRYGGK
jgi:phage terminase small subunit